MYLKSRSSNTFIILVAVWKVVIFQYGSERESKGYILVKVAEPNVWIEKHRYVYESMYGNIPTGHKIIFADKNTRNFEPDNLILVSDSEALIMNTQKLIYEEAELTKTGALIAKVIDKTNKLKHH